MADLPPSLDADNPWPGLEAFDEDASDYFFGRAAEIDELLHRIEQAPVTVLFGQSGLGKSSLLRAGLMPALRARHHLPVLVRLDWRASAPPPERQLRDALQRVLTREGIDAPPFGADEPLWTWLHRDGLELWDKRNFPCTPIFLIDQFEEVFTLAEHAPERVARWRSDLGDLAENRIPGQLGEAEVASQGLQLRSMRYKLLVSLREDFLPELESWRRALPSIGRNRMRLLPLQPAQALQAVQGPGAHLMDEALARRVVQFVAAAQVDMGGEPAAAPATSSAVAPAASASTPPASSASATALSPAAAPTLRQPPADSPVADDLAIALLQEMSAPLVRIEPALLSLFCRGLNEQRKRQGQARFDDALLDGAKQGILSDYYKSCFEGMPESVSRFVATELITEKGYRNSVSKDDATPAHLAEDQLAHLIDRRLLRVEERYGALRIELTHDLLTRVVREHRDRLRHEVAEAERASEAAAAALAQRTALEAQMRERESRLQEERLTEARTASRRFKQVAMGLAGVLALAVALAATAYVQRNAVIEAQHVEQKLRLVAERQITVAEARYQRMADSLGMKRAVVSGDLEAVRQYIAKQEARRAQHDAKQGPAPWRPSFAASAVPYGYKQGGRDIYNIRLMPTPAALAKMRQQVAVVTFRMDHPSFRNALLITGEQREFTASYEGWGCLTSVLVLVEYVDPDRASEIAEYDMCKALGWS